MRAGRSGTERARKLRLNATQAERHLWSGVRADQIGSVSEPSLPRGAREGRGGGGV